MLIICGRCSRGGSGRRAHLRCQQGFAAARPCCRRGAAAPASRSCPPRAPLCSGSPERCSHHCRAALLWQAPRLAESCWGAAGTPRRAAVPGTHRQRWWGPPIETQLVLAEAVRLECRSLPGLPQERQQHYWLLRRFPGACLLRSAKAEMQAAHPRLLKCPERAVLRCACPSGQCALAELPVPPPCVMRQQQLQRCLCHSARLQPEPQGEEATRSARKLRHCCLPPLWGALQRRRSSCGPRMALSCLLGWPAAPPAWRAARSAPS